MPSNGNTFQNNDLAALTRGAPQHVLSAIKKASHRTGVDFAYLMEKAGAESNFNPGAKARTSSATGLFQFIEKTWMGMVKTHGAKYGLSEYAAKIDNHGRVSDSATRKQILELRKDPQIASYMAAEFASDNESYLKKTIGGDIGPTELYFAHFLGAGGASGFLSQHQKNPSAIAADLFPKEALANRNVFYDSKTGKAKTLGQIYDAFDHKFTDDILKPAPTSQIAGADDGQMFRAYKVSAFKYVTPPAAPAAPRPDTSAILSDDITRAMMGSSDWRVFPSSLYQNASLDTATLLILSNERYND